MRIITQAQDVTEHILVLVINCVEDWYPYGQPLEVEEFIDRLCDNYGNAEEWDIETLDSPAVRKIMRHARRRQRELA